MSEKILQSDAGMIESFFNLITQNWRSQGAENCLLEVRCLSENKQSESRKFTCEQIHDAIEFAEHMNTKKLNIYMTINPIEPNAGKNAKDENIKLAFFSFADADKLPGVDALEKFCDIQKPEFTVITGRTPHLRFHGYWRLLEPCSDMALWRKTQEHIALNFKTDTVVKNPSRIMRIPGTISYPDNKKRAKGYIDELVELRINENPTPLVDISQWADLLPKPKTPESLQIDLGYNFLDLEAVKAAALRGQNWHGNMLRLVGSWVAKGFSDQEILAYVQEFTLPGYTQAQTRNELIKMINGARKKGFDQKIIKPRTAM